MPDKPATADGYPPEQTESVLATCLYVATKLGDLMDDIVVVGGLVPSLLVDQAQLPPGAEHHIGTMDLDVGLALGLLAEERYRTLTERLRQAQFVRDVNESGNAVRQRWKLKAVKPVTIDFLIPPSKVSDHRIRIRNIERDFAALITPGLGLAFRDRRKIVLRGQTIFGERATRDVWVCGPGAYVVLKALAFKGRGENKDAYDLYYLIRNYGSGVADVAPALETLVRDPDARRALDVLKEDFLELDATGPMRVAMFLQGAPDDDIQADVASQVDLLLRSVRGYRHR